MKNEGISELKELDRIIQEYASIKRDYTELFEEKERLKRELQKRLSVEEVKIRISKTKLEAILKEHYNCECVKIEKIKVGTPITTPTVYPCSLMHTLLLDTDIIIKRKKNENNIS